MLLFPLSLKIELAKFFLQDYERCNIHVYKTYRHPVDKFMYTHSKIVRKNYPFSIGLTSLANIFQINIKFFFEGEEESEHGTYSPGDTVRVRIEGIDEKRGQLALTLLDLAP